jgi:hypothetical protein
MKTSVKLVMLAMVGAMAISGCSPRDEDQKTQQEKYQGREETKHLSDTDAVGYAGTPVRKKLDKALDANDQRKDNLDQAIEQQSNQ